MFKNVLKRMFLVNEPNKEQFEVETSEKHLVELQFYFFIP